MRENMPKTMIQSLLQSFGGGGTVGSAGGKEASQLDRSPEVRKAGGQADVQDDVFSFVKRTYRLIVLSLKNKLSSRFTLHSSLKKRVAFTLAEGATHVALPTSQRKSAFTLAEVLITLGIIGVVAAITIPALMANYQKMVQRQQFKKAYNTVYNAFRLAETNLGYHPMCYYGDDNKGGECLEYDDKGECIKWGNYIVNSNQNSDCDVLKNEMKKTLNIIKICEGNGVADGCIPEYNGIDKIYTDNKPDATEQEITTGTTGESGWRTNNIRTKAHVWVLSDGVIFVLYNDWIKYFVFDINGMKGPNKWGYDLFPFQLKSNLDKPLYLTPVNRIEKGGVTCTKMLQDIGR